MSMHNDNGRISVSAGVYWRREAHAHATTTPCVCLCEWEFTRARMRKCARGCAATWDWGSGVAARCPSRQQPTQRTARHSCTQWVVAPVRLWPPRLPHCALKPFLDILVSTSYRNRFQIQKRNGLGSSEMVHAPAADLVNPSEMVHGCRCPVFSTPGDNCIT